MVSGLAESVSLSDQRAKFQELNEREALRVSEGLGDPHRSAWSLSESTSRANSSRNRYTNVLPWDKNRVKLEAKEGGSNYINASYIDLDGETRYIACQGPLSNTLHHFWSMSYSESEKQKTDTIIVVMVTPTKEDSIIKCAQYWPTESTESLQMTSSLQKDKLVPDSLILSYKSSSYNSSGGYLLTEMSLKSAEKTKRVLHYYYPQWSDSRVPPSVDHLLILSKDIANTKAREANKPIPIVHCSAGVGRTGTFIVLDYLLNSRNRPQNDKKDPVMDITSQLRDNRMMMVQTIHQFTFLYSSLKDLNDFL